MCWRWGTKKPGPSVSTRNGKNCWCWFLRYWLLPLPWLLQGSSVSWVWRFPIWQPRIILLDEPLSHLDLFNQARLIGLLKRLTEAGMTVLAVLHDPNPALLFYDCIVCLRNGEVALPPAAGALTPWDAVFLSEVYGLNLETVPYRGKALIAPVGSEGGNQNGNA